jgi:rhombotail lipoprotein
MKTLIAIVAALSAAGCAAEFPRTEMQRELEQDGRQILVDDADVLHAGQVRPQLPLPFRMAVVPPSMMNSHRWGVPEELEGERKEIAAWGDRLRAEGVITDLVIIPQMLVRVGNNHPEFYRQLRVAAARLGADALLILNSVSDVDSYVNPLAVLDITIVGMFVVPGHHKDALTMVEGIMVDNRNQFVYLALSAEGTGTTCGTLVSLQERSAIQKSRVAALKNFGDQLVTEARRVPLDGGGPRYGTPGK